MTTLRSAVPDDSPRLLEIYGEYIGTNITFEYELPSEEEFRNRVRETLEDCYPYLVAEEESGIVGYAYAGRFQRRAAYQWGAELSVYLSKAARGRSLGTLLYGRLMACLKERGIRTVYGCVTVPNTASERLHEKFGFRRIGVFRKAGFKNGAWHDVAWFEKAIGDYGVPAPLGGRT